MSFVPPTYLSAYLSSNLDPSASSHSSSSVHPVEVIKPFLSSRSTLDQFLFLSCLVQLPVSIWAGSKTSASPDEPVVESQKMESTKPVLIEREVGRIMSFLESDDTSVRKLVCILFRLGVGMEADLWFDSLRRLYDFYTKWTLGSYKDITINLSIPSLHPQIQTMNKPSYVSWISCE